MYTILVIKFVIKIKRNNYIFKNINLRFSCDANSNIFNTIEECEGKCVKPNGTEICKLPLVNPTNQCQNNVTRYFYDVMTSSCKKFSYSGCFGNENNFESLEHCERKCQIPLLFGN